MPSMIELKGITKVYGTGAQRVPAIGNVSFTVEAGEFVSIVGPSGCGKSTLLNMIAGFLPPTSGRWLCAWVSCWKSWWIS